MIKLSEITILSFGGGQDSTGILYKLIYDKEFRAKYAPSKLVVVMADTANEHNETYMHVFWVVKLCEKLGIPFYFLTGEMGYTSKSWSKGLIHFYEQHNAVGSKAFPKTCTDKLKITPIYNWLENYIHVTYKTKKVGRKNAIKEFTAKYGKINVLLGIAKGEERRASTNEESLSQWMKYCINKLYPLIDIGLDRQGCQDYIKSLGYTVPPPSNCILCPFLSYQELLFLYRYMNDWYQKWVELEAAKLKANTHLEPKRNLGVWGAKTLPEALAIAEQKYGHMTEEELRDYKMSHGHCVTSKY